MASKNLGPWIALAGAFIGVGLYLGLRDRSHAPTARDTPAASHGTGSPQPAPRRELAEIERDLRTALEPQRAAWRRACWEPIVATSPTPSRSVHVLSIAVDADGNEILRSINDVREQTRGDVATCLREQPHAPIKIRAPGQSTSTTIEIELP